MLKQFLLFSYYDYYPLGGFDDFKKDFNSHEEAFNYIKNTYEEGQYDEYQIVDLKGGKIKYYDTEFNEIRL